MVQGTYNGRLTESRGVSNFAIFAAVDSNADFTHMHAMFNCFRNLVNSDICNALLVFFSKKWQYQNY